MFSLHAALNSRGQTMTRSVRNSTWPGMLGRSNSLSQQAMCLTYATYPHYYSRHKMTVEQEANFDKTTEE